MKRMSYRSLDSIAKRLLDEAEKAMETAYNPQSGFYVGAALLSRKGEIITGSNVENAALGSTICAERAALVRANAEEIRIFDRIAIIARGETFDTENVTGPCGSCRQMLYESSQVSEKDFEVIMSTTKKDKIIIATIGELLPFGFGPKELGKDISKYQRL